MVQANNHFPEGRRIKITERPLISLAISQSSHGPILHRSAFFSKPYYVCAFLFFLFCERARHSGVQVTMPASSNIPPIVLPFISERAKETLDLVILLKAKCIICSHRYHSRLTQTFHRWKDSLITNVFPRMLSSRPN